MTRVAGIDIERCTHCRTGRWRARRRYQWRTCPAGLARHRNRDGQSLNRRRVVATATRCPYIPHSTAAAAVLSNKLHLTRPAPQVLGRIAGASYERFPLIVMNNYPSLLALLELSEILRGIETRTRSSAEVESLLSRFCFDRTMLGGPVDSSKIWIRATKLSDDETLNCVKRLIYRPTPPDSLGRANLVGQKVMYGASHFRVALDEIEAAAGDRIGIAHYRARTDRVINSQMIGEFEHIFNSGSSLMNCVENERTVASLSSKDDEHTKISYFVDSTLAELFRRQTRDYIVTATYANHVFSRRLGLLYPSVRMIGGINFATSSAMFDESFEVVGAAELEVGRCIGKGLYSYTVLRESSQFQSDGTIDWSVASSVVGVNEAAQLTAPKGFTGWRVNDA